MTRYLYPLFAVCVIALGAIGVSRLSFNVDLLKLLPPTLPGVEGTAAFQKFHDRADELWVTVQTADDVESADLAAELATRLAAEPNLTGTIQSEPAWRTNPAGLIELTAHSWLNAPPEKLLALEATLAPEHIESMLKGRVGMISETFNPLTATIASRDPLGLGAILEATGEMADDPAGGDGFTSADGTFHLIKVTTPRPLHGYRELATWLARVRQVAESWRQAQPAASAVRLGFTGSPAFEAEIGTGMERDMSQSISGISIIVGLLFWLLHRRLQPLILLMVAMLVAGLLTLGVAGLTFGTLDVMSMGFAAILMGMIEDFGVMGLHEAMRRPNANFWSVHAAIFPSVAWSAVTSAALFAVLGLSTLPGIARMGLLTALGIVIGAAVMLYGFLPLAMRRRDYGHVPEITDETTRFRNWPGWLALLLLLGSSSSLIWRGPPTNTHDTGILRPRHCLAYNDLTNLQDHLQPARSDSQWLPVIIQSQSADDLATSMQQLESRLVKAAAAGETVGHFLPTAMIPNPTHQAANLPVMARIVASRARLDQAMDNAGFTPAGMTFSKQILDIWQQWSQQPNHGTRWPTDGLLETYIGPILRRDHTGIAACGFIKLSASDDPAQATILTEIQQDPRVRVGGLNYLSGQLKELLRNEVKRVLLPALAVLTGLLFFVFRNMRERLVAVGSLAFSGLLLLGAMSASGIAWNFVNIGAVPLILGLGLDFNIHMLHALRERGADGHGIGRALAYCGFSTGLGFGALGLSDNAGLASFGQTSMIGVLATLLTAAFIVPWLWRHLSHRQLD